MLDCIHNDPNYNYIYALNNYMKYITDISLKDETKETSKTSEVIKEDIQLSKDDEILKLKEEVEMLKQQLSSDGNNIYLKGK